MIPDYQAFMRPVLALAADKERPIRDCVSLAADAFELSTEQRETLLPSGRQTTVANRVHWAVTYMAHAGLVERPRRGVIIATPLGHRILSQHTKTIDNSVLMKFPAFQEFRNRSKVIKKGNGDILNVPNAIEAETPEERIETAASELTAALRDDLLARITAANPTFFEHLIINLMLAMGYGGSGSGKHLGKTNDGGVDGIINEDPLGLDIVFLQAKRYATGNVIGVDKIREFAGSLDEKGAVKGVFVTTSHFAPQAKTYAERSPKRLILIDGDELTRLMVRYDVGVRTYQTIHLKKIDDDYFSETNIY